MPNRRVSPGGRAQTGRWCRLNVTVISSRRIIYGRPSSSSSRDVVRAVAYDGPRRRSATGPFGRERCDDNVTGNIRSHGRRRSFTCDRHREPPFTSRKLTRRERKNAEKIKKKNIPQKHTRRHGVRRWRLSGFRTRTRPRQFKTIDFFFTVVVVSRLPVRRRVVVYLLRRETVDRTRRIVRRCADDACRLRVRVVRKQLKLKKKKTWNDKCKEKKRVVCVLFTVSRRSFY